MREPDIAQTTALAELALLLEEHHVLYGRDADAGTLWVADPGQRLHVLAVPAPTTGQLRDAITQAAGTTIVVADRLAEPQRAVLRAAGWSWWDRRGDLHVQGRGSAIDLTPAALAPPATSGPAPFSRTAGRTVGLVLLRDPEAPRSVRDLAGATGLSTGAAGRATQELTELGLIDRRNVPADPRALFSELVRWWRPVWHGVNASIGPDGPLLDEIMRFGIGPGATSGPGWAVASTDALLAYGGDAPLHDGHPLRLYVPDERALAWSLHRWGIESEGDGEVEIAMAPTPAALVNRRVWGSAGSVPWRLADPIVLALTLASSSSQADRDALDTWRPTPGSNLRRLW